MYIFINFLSMGWVTSHVAAFLFSYLLKSCVCSSSCAVQTWLYKGGSSKHCCFSNVKIQLAEFNRELDNWLKHRVDIISALSITGRPVMYVVGQHHCQTSTDRQQSASVPRHCCKLTGDTQAEQLWESCRYQRNLVRWLQLHQTTLTGLLWLPPTADGAWIYSIQGIKMGFLVISIFR